MISVIIPTFNRSFFLKEAIHSVITQDVTDCELIIVDDGSTDETREVVHRLGDLSSVEVRYFFQENCGAAAARNLGIRKARGNLLCFLDSDDRFEPGKLSLQKDLLEQSDCRISHTREKWLRRGIHLNQKQKHQPQGGYIFPQCLPMCVVGMSTVMVEKAVFERYGLFDEALPCCEDYDFWLRVSSGEKFLLVSRPLTVKNGGREDQLSVIHRIGIDRYRIASLVSLLDSGLLDSGQFLLAAEELERKCRIYGNGCLKHGRRDEGERYLQLPKKYLGNERVPIKGSDGKTGRCGSLNYQLKKT